MEAAGKTRGRPLRPEGACHQQCGRHPADGSVVESGRLSAQRRRNRARHRSVRRSIMTSKLLASLAAIAALSIGAAIAAPVNYKVPEETAAFKPGPNLEV